MLTLKGIKYRDGEWGQQEVFWQVLFFFYSHLTVVFLLLVASCLFVISFPLCSGSIVCMLVWVWVCVHVNSRMQGRGWWEWSRLKTDRNRKYWQLWSWGKIFNECILIFLILSPFFPFLFVWFCFVLERGEGRGRDRERNTDVREKNWLVTFHTHPNQRLNP